MIVHVLPLEMKSRLERGEQSSPHSAAFQNLPLLDIRKQTNKQNIWDVSQTVSQDSLYTMGHNCLKDLQKCDWETPYVSLDPEVRTQN